MFLSQEPDLTCCGFKDEMPRTRMRWLQATVCTPSCTQCPDLPFQFGCSSQNFSLLGEQQFLPATPETTLLITLLCCSPLREVVVPRLGESSCRTLLCCGKTSFLQAKQFSYKRETIFSEHAEVIKAFSLTSLTLYSLLSRLICVQVTVRTSNDKKP